MPDQPATPPKPKPGSLRDRIAAFEKPAASGPAPGPAPAHRPKPGGISWKPKVPSPPSSPSSPDHAERKAVGGMSASDAKESIGKGGSLKERMAALQNRGGFGAPPPIAPKPALEKPKWKPPPVITPVDKDDDEEVLPRGESSKSPPPLSPPPLARKSVDEGSLKEPVDEEPVTAAPEGEDQVEADPEDEERQRRAAIAARMARLGGARVGMAPMFAPKPVAKKPEPVGEPAKAKPTSDEQVVPPKEPTTEEVTPPIEPATEEQPSISPEPSEIPPATKESESTTSLSPDQPPQSRGPGAMPLPSAPRRAAPPRKKAAKSPSPEQHLPPAPVVEEETLVRSPVPAPALASAEASELAAIVPESAKKEETGELQAEVTELGEVENKNVEDSAVPPPPSELEYAIVAEPTPVVATDLAEKDATQGESIAAKEPSLEVKESTEKTAEDEEGLIEPPKSVDVTPPSHAASVPEEAREDEEEEEEEEEEAKKLHEPLEAEPKALAQEIPPSTIEETKEELTSQAQATYEPDEEEEAARHKRLAEKVAKMGGINPFALPPQPHRKPSVSSDDAHTTVSPRASVSREPSIGSPPPPPPQRRQSTRKDSVDSTVVHDVPSQPQPQRKPSMSSDDSSVRREPSIGSPPLIPPQRRQSTRKDSVDSSTLVQEPPTILQSPVPARKDSADFDSTPTAPSESEHAIKKRNSQDDHGLVGPSQGFAVGGDIPEEIEYVEEEEEEEEEIISDDDEQRKTTTYQSEMPTRNELVEDLEKEVIEVAPPPSLPPSSPPPPVPKSTRPLPVVPVDPALPIDPIPIPPRPAQTHHTAVSPPARSLPPPPPPRLVEEEAEDEEVEQEEEEEEQWKAARAPPKSQYVDEDEDEDVDSDGDEIEPPRRLPPRSLPTSIEDDGSPVPVPVPVPNRRSSRDARSSLHIPPHRAIPPPPPPPQDVEQDSDFDEVLPTPPRRLPKTPGTPPTNEIPLIVPPPHEEEGQGARKVDRSPLRQSVHANVVPAPVVVSRGEAPSPSHLSVSDQEIYDEEEGDPIDPSFHSPSRRASAIILPPTSPPPPPPREPVPETGEEEETAQQAHRRTIAERMAKLGGIKFGAAPLPASVRPTSPPTKTEEEAPTAAPVPAGPEGEGEHVELSEEEEERARKERIAAKLAGMGGMRIGMLPLGVGTLRPQHSHVLTGNAPHPPPPARAQPPPPPPQDSDAELEGNLSASQQSFSTTSEDGVKVEAEESEIEEVSHEDAVEEEVEEVPPPVPDRGARRRGTGSESEVLHSPTVASYPRPPVPTTLPTKRSSVQTTTSVRKSSVESSGSVPVPRSSTHKPHSEYVMVEEPSGFTSDDTVPPLPPARPTSRVPHPSRGVPPPPPPATELSDSSLTQWELPSIPSSSLTFGATPDLSLSWTEEPATSPTVSSPPPPPPPEKPAAQQPTAERHLSPDDLIAVWGRVGVQICEVATSLFEKSKRSLVGDGTYTGFVNAVLSEVPNASLSSYGYVIYVQSGTAVQKRVSEIMPGDIVVLQDAKLKGHKGIHAYHQNVGVGEELVGVVSEFEPKKSKIRVFQANQHVGQQTVEAVSYRLEDLKSGTVKIYRVLEN